MTNLIVETLVVIFLMSVSYSLASLYDKMGWGRSSLGFLSLSLIQVWAILSYVP